MADPRKKVKTEEPVKDLLPQDALASVLKFLQIEAKCHKAVEKVYTLFSEYLTSFHPEHVL
jgi:hypothetical protein